MGFAITPVLVAFGILLWSGGSIDLAGFVIVGIVGTLPPTIVGFSLYLILQSRLRPSPWSCGLFGACAAIMGWAPLMLANEPLPWTDIFHALSAIGAGGLIGGLIFWLIAAADFKLSE